MKANPIRAVALDFFGTLLEIKARRSPYRQLLQWGADHGRKGRPEAAAILMSAPLTLHDAASTLGLSPPEEVIKAWQQDLAAEIQSIAAYQDTVATLEALKRRGYLLAVCSNLAAPYGPPAKHLMPQVSTWVFSYEAGAIKPDPRFYQRLLEDLGCEADEVLFIGDTQQANVDGPRQSGLKARLLDRQRGATLENVLTDMLP